MRPKQKPKNCYHCLRVSGDIMELTEAWKIVKKQKGNVQILQAERDKDGVWIIVYAPVTPGPVVRVHPDGRVEE